jgi:hypothetical protein
MTSGFTIDGVWCQAAKSRETTEYPYLDKISLQPAPGRKEIPPANMLFLWLGLLLSKEADN